MRRLARHLFTLASAASVLLCVAVCVLWARAYSGGDQFTGTLAGGRHTLVSDRTGLVFHGPRRPARDRQARQTFRELAASMRNEQVTWTLRANPRASDVGFSRPLPREGTPAEALWRASGSADVEPPLLAALDDPERFAAAHVLLARRQWMMGRRDHPWGYEAMDGPYRMPLFPDAYEGSGLPDAKEPPKRANYDGLWVELRMRESEWLALPQQSYKEELLPVPCDARIDPGQLGRVRDEWHRRLDVTLASVAHRTAAAACLVLPGWSLAAWLFRRQRCRARLRRGLCPSCAYDLRASPGRCPECGAVPGAQPCGAGAAFTTPEP